MNLGKQQTEADLRSNRISSSSKKLLGSWQLHQLISRGVLTSVYEARPLGCPPSRPADYVVKVLRREYVENSTARTTMQREAEVGRHRSHPNLVPILEACLDYDPPFVVMPKINGASLSSVIPRVGSVSVPQTLWLVRQIAQALQHLHQQGWVHGDIKPANIVVSREGHATLVDLGFVMRREESFFTNTCRPLVGTLSYLAPELLTSTCSTQPPSDIYSLGITMYEMLAGQLPFTVTEPARIVEAHLHQTPPELDPFLHVPSAVESFLRRMLSKSSFRRPQSMEELLDGLVLLEIETFESRFRQAA